MNVQDFTRARYHVCFFVSRLLLVQRTLSNADVDLVIHTLVMRWMTRILVSPIFDPEEMIKREDMNWNLHFREFPLTIIDVMLCFDLVADVPLLCLILPALDSLVLDFIDIAHSRLFLVEHLGAAHFRGRRRFRCWQSAFRTR